MHLCFTSSIAGLAHEMDCNVASKFALSKNAGAYARRIGRSGRLCSPSVSYIMGRPNFYHTEPKLSRVLSLFSSSLGRRREPRMRAERDRRIRRTRGCPIAIATMTTGSEWYKHNGVTQHRRRQLQPRQQQQLLRS